MSKSNCEPALLSSLETLQHNLQDAGRLASWLHDMADGRWRDHNGYVPEVVK
ncbi:hypothetical protein [Bifidobacterium breve]|jgi:hypothetical protein|uniref:hypothetical protein n=1 Tax=Bifidobacterium breve TaxID=1685 RepID=UPI0015F28A8E|nr:hypothetical protein [Bifidobacterium breve]